jgi:hypothetical protein
MNSFADLKSDEFAAKYLMAKGFGNTEGAPQDTKKCTGAQAPETNLPESVDWSAKGYYKFYFRWCYTH